MLVWHGKLWLIDHGAALYFHHSAGAISSSARRAPFAAIKDHVLLPLASRLDEADAAMTAPPHARASSPRSSRSSPTRWLDDDRRSPAKAAQRAAYASYFARRLQAPRAFAQEAARARSLHV